MRRQDLKKDPVSPEETETNLAKVRFMYSIVQDKEANRNMR